MERLLGLDLLRLFELDQALQVVEGLLQEKLVAMGQATQRLNIADHRFRTRLADSGPLE